MGCHSSMCAIAVIMWAVASTIQDSVATVWYASDTAWDIIAAVFGVATVMWDTETSEQAAEADMLVGTAVMYDVVDNAQAIAGYA